MRIISIRSFFPFLSLSLNIPYDAFNIVHSIYIEFLLDSAEIF